MLDALGPSFVNVQRCQLFSGEWEDDCSDKFFKLLENLPEPMRMAAWCLILDPAKKLKARPSISILVLEPPSMLAAMNTVFQSITSHIYGI